MNFVPTGLILVGKTSKFLGKINSKHSPITVQFQNFVEWPRKSNLSGCLSFWISEKPSLLMDGFLLRKNECTSDSKIKIHFCINFFTINWKWLLQKHKNEVCYGNIFYFWRLETRLFSRHFFLDFGMNVHFSFVNSFWECDQGCVGQTCENSLSLGIRFVQDWKSGVLFVQCCLVLVNESWVSSYLFTSLNYFSFRTFWPGQ